MIDILKKIIPFELTRKASAISIVIALILTGFFGEIGKWVFEKMILSFRSLLPSISVFFSWAMSVTFEISLLGLFFYVLAFIIFLFPIYRYFDRRLLKGNEGEVIFYDDFTYNKGWSLNYWGTTNPEKTTKIENSFMVFGAREDEILNEKKEFGSCIDIRDGIYDGYTYEIICKVKSDPDTTMGFQLWIHDTVGGNKNVSKFEPVSFFTPGEELMDVKLKYRANSSNAIRVHLHNKAGNGRILVDKVIISKI